MSTTLSTTEAHPVIAEMHPDGESVVVVFDYNPKRVLAIKEVPSRRFVPPERGGPHWKVNLDWATMKRLREIFGDELGLGPKLNAWGHGEKDRVTELSSLSDANDAELENVPKRMVTGVKLKGMKKKFKLRPYQKADAKFMSKSNVIVANQPRTGKTITTLCAIFEAEAEWGCHVVFAPKTSLRSVWEKEINLAYKLAGYDEPTVLTGDNPDERKAAIAEAKELFDDDRAFWLVLNPYHCRMKRVKVGEGDDFKFEEELISPELAEVFWDSITVDEYHMMGLSNPTTVSARGMNFIAEATQPTHKFALSGTPMGGKPIKLWGALHFLNPEEFTSRWNWARHWLVINSGQYGSNIEGIMPGREVDFYEHLKPYLVRRTQREALPGLPPTMPIDVWCEMTPHQHDQYKQFATQAEWRIADKEEQQGGRLTATNVLAEYTRLKQFASAYCDVQMTSVDGPDGLPKIEIKYTKDSGKLEKLVEKLEECNVISIKKDEDDDLKCATVFSQFKPFSYLIAEFLHDDHGVPTAVITGDTADQHRTLIVEAFQQQSMKPLEQLDAGRGATPDDILKLLKDNTPPRVLVMNTLVGGAALTLDRGETCHIMDETWVPDEQEQAANRVTPVSEFAAERTSTGVYFYRSNRSIEEYIQKLVADKQLNNKTVLDLRRRMQRDLEAAEKASA